MILGDGSARKFLSNARGCWCLRLSGACGGCTFFVGVDVLNEWLSSIRDIMGRDL